MSSELRYRIAFEAEDMSSSTTNQACVYLHLQPNFSPKFVITNVQLQTLLTYNQVSVA